MKLLKKLDSNMLIVSLLSMVLGFFLLFYPADTQNIIYLYIAGVLIALGTKWLCVCVGKKNKDKYLLVAGILLICAGIFFIVSMYLENAYCTYGIGTIILLYGLVKIDIAKKLKSNRYKWAPLVFFTVICIFLGIMVAMIPLNENDDGTKVIGNFAKQSMGVILLFTGFVDFITSVTATRKVKECEEISKED